MTVPHHSEPARESGFVDGYDAALRDVEVFRIKIAEPFDSSFGTIKGFVRDMLATNAEKLRSSLSASPAATSGPTYVVNCCNCGRIIDTREESEGGDQWGHELSDDRWVCSPECLDAVTDPDAVPAATSAETQGGDGGRIVPTDKAEALQAIIDEMKRERKAMCEALGCVDLPGVPLKFVHEQRDRLSKAWQREVELIRSWDRASLTERQELDEMRRGWGPTTPTERMRRKADVQAAMQCLSSAMADLTLSEDEAEAADDEVNRRLDEAYQRVSKQYVATIAILNSMDDPLQLPDLDAALAPSTSAATRGDAEQYRRLAVGLQLERDQAQNRIRELEDKLVDAAAGQGRWWDKPAPPLPRDAEAAYPIVRDAVLASGAPSPRFVQQRFAIGFNRASGFIERMEAEGLITAWQADIQGRRIRASLDLATDAEG